MKKKIIFLWVSALFLLSAQLASAQAPLAPDQNPDYKVSQDKYMGIADSVNALHSTTPQETYKAIDYLADKQEARELRRAERRERARYGTWYNYYGYNYPAYYDPYYYYNGRNRFLWNTVPLTLSLGYYRYHSYHRPYHYHR